MISAMSKLTLSIGLSSDIYKPGASKSTRKFVIGGWWMVDGGQHTVLCEYLHVCIYVCNSRLMFDDSIDDSNRRASHGKQVSRALSLSHRNVYGAIAPPSGRDMRGSISTSSMARTTADPIPLDKESAKAIHVSSGGQDCWLRFGPRRYSIECSFRLRGPCHLRRRYDWPSVLAWSGTGQERNSMGSQPRSSSAPSDESTVVGSVSCSSFPAGALVWFPAPCSCLRLPQIACGPCSVCLSVRTLYPVRSLLPPCSFNFVELSVRGILRFRSIEQSFFTFATLVLHCDPFVPVSLAHI